MNPAISVESLLSGDKQAASDFYHYYHPKLLRYIQKRVNSEKDAEEILQDTLFAFLEALRDYNGASNLETYLFSICHHKVIDFYRKKKLTHVVFSKVPKLESLLTPLMTLEDQLDHAQLKLKIRRTLRQLIPQYRDIITLKYVDGLSVQEIASKFSTTIKSIEMKLFRARKAFVEAFISI